MNGQIASPATATNIELRVVIRGLKLSDTTRKLIDAAVQSAVLQELASIDLQGVPKISPPATDPQTRSILGNLANPHIMGLVATPEF